MAPGPPQAAPQQARARSSRLAPDAGVGRGMAVSNGSGGSVVLTTAVTLHAYGMRGALPSRGLVV